MDPQLRFAFERLGLALLLGLLVGLQREHAASKLGGLRTFALISLLGALCGLAAREFGGWAAAAGLLGVVALVVVGNVSKIKAGLASPGVTTEAAMLVTYGAGLLLIVAPPAAAICFFASSMASR